MKKLTYKLNINFSINKILCSLLLMTIISGCGVPQADYDKLSNENIQLLSDLDECKNGAKRIIAEVQKAYTEKNYSMAKQGINNLYERHPESPKNKEFKELTKKIEKEEIAIKKREEAAEKERIRLANFNNTGMWSVRYYVDDFGEYTKEGYIRNTSLIRGTFSNTATQDTELDVKFLISNSSDISIQLYEYAGNNPVKASSTDYYTVQVQDKDGKRMSMRASNYSERLSLGKTDSRRLHNALMKGGELKFKITEDDRPTTQYKFTIQNADWYENAYRKLKES